ncbi:MAG: CvpA family protein [Eudoraea sp.]|nr:CvpA family protein [Eudoraea sp.]MBT8222548.1 CvpA family protein [Eudoraea sp.]MBT8322693.1 CvpA family protein [Eudoraea sp.]
MGILDIVLGILLAYGFYRGLRNGLFVEIASLLALIAGLYGAIHLSYITGNYLQQRVDWDENYVSIIAFIITFFAIVLLVHILGKLITKIIELTVLGLLNKIAGGIFGAVKVAVILGAILIFFEKANDSLNLFEKESTEDSVLYDPVKNLGAFVFGAVINHYNQSEEEEPDQQ